MAIRPKRYLHRKHTGKLAAHRHTNYGSLFAFMMLAGVSLLGMTASVQAEDVTLRAVVPAAAPTRPAQILKPLNGQNFSENNIEVLGTCLPTTLVRIYTNDILAGAVFCQPNGTFQLIISLFSGTNQLVARSSDALGQEAPPSLPVTVYFNNTLNPGATGSGDLILRVDQQYRGYDVGEETSWPVSISGGNPPYALNIDWGDGQTEVISQATPGIVTFKHRYSKAGPGSRGDYRIIITASDTGGHSRRVQLTVIISERNGGLAPLLSTPGGRLQLAWPIWIVLLLMVISFWLGERREKQLLGVR